MLRTALALVLLLVASAAQAAQIYLCRTHQGAEYWAQNWCSKTGGYTVDAVTVPDGMPFEKQARVADQLRGKKLTAQARDDKDRDKAATCRAIDDELAAIWKRYDNGQFNEAANIGRDQTRTRELKKQRRQLSCQTR